MLQGQILHKFQVAQVKKYQRTREDVSLQHVPETRPGNFFTSVPTLLHVPATCPCYTALQHVPSVCTYLDFFPATFCSYMFLQYVPSCGPTLKLALHGKISNLLSDLFCSLWRFMNGITCTKRVTFRMAGFVSVVHRNLVA